MKFVRDIALLIEKLLVMESRTIKWFYKGEVEGNVLMKIGYKCEIWLRMLYRNIR